MLDLIFLEEVYVSWIVRIMSFLRDLIWDGVIFLES